MQEQIAPMEKVIESSKGMLAPISGDERFQSVGCGHTSQFIKAAVHGCITPVKSIQNGNGCIDVAKLSRDAEIKSMLDEGWDWEVMPWQCEATWGHEFADTFQRALNASHEVASSISELEVAVSMAECVPGEGATTADWELAQVSATSGNPPCAPYANLLRELAQYYGGGVGAPLLLKLDAFAKQFGENRCLGEEFIFSIVRVKFPNDSVFPRIRDACMATNLTATKVVDGVARLLTKTDIIGLTGKLKYDAVVQCDKQLTRAAAIADAIIENVPQLEGALIAEEGLFKIRIVCRMCCKGSKTFEAIDYKSDCQIIAKYLEAITTMLENEKIGDIRFLKIPSEWNEVLTNAKHTNTKAEKKPGGAVALTTSEVASKTHIAKQKGFEIGKYVVERSVIGRAIYRIDTIGAVCALTEVDIFKAEPVTCTVPFDKFSSGWAPYSGEIPTYVRGDWVPKYVDKKVSIKIEAEKCKLFLAMASYFEETASDPALVRLCLKPNGLRAVTDISKGALVMVPMGNFPAISTTCSSTSIDTGHSKVIAGETIAFYVSQPSQPRADSVDNWGQDDYANPIWWVTTTSIEEKVNIVTKVVKVDGVSQKVYVNKRAVSSMELLHIYKAAAAEKVSLRDATITAAPAPKRQKKDKKDA